MQVKHSKSDQALLVKVLDHLGILYWDRGLLDRALEYCNRSILISQVILKDSIPPRDIINRRANRAVVLRDAGQLRQAEEALIEVIREQKTLPEEVFTNSFSRNNLATIYLLQGRLFESKDLFEGLLRGTGAPEDNEPATLLVKHNLACLYETMGDTEKAISLLRSILNRKEVQLGLWSPATLKTAITLGRLYREHEQVEEAKELADKIRPYLDYA
jgi:predicted Zn-dependent protease